MIKETILKSNVAELQAVYAPTGNDIKKVKISHSKGSADYLRELFNSKFNGMIEHREAFTILMLNRANNVIGWSVISIGGTNETVVDPKTVFQMALLANASAIILCHNHPSGEVMPSHEDKQITRRLVDGGKLLTINVLDHIILSADFYFSFADEGIL